LTTLKNKMTDAYASIEQMSELEAAPHFDMWALGVMIYRMMLGEEPFRYNNQLIQADAIKSNRRKSLPTEYS
jgi:serine/threonine protein kinase